MDYSFFAINTEFIRRVAVGVERQVEIYIVPWPRVTRPAKYGFPNWQDRNFGEICSATDN
jgi:hypothetical protein